MQKFMQEKCIVLLDTIKTLSTLMYLSENNTGRKVIYELHKSLVL